MIIINKLIKNIFIYILALSIVIPTLNFNVAYANETSNTDNESISANSDNNVIYYSEQVPNNNGGGGGFVFPVGSGTVLPYIKILGKDPNKVKHILDPKHYWNRVSSGKWSDVEKIMSAVMREGKESAYYSIRKKSLTRYGHTVEVTFTRVNGKIKVSNGWVKK